MVNTMTTKTKSSSSKLLATLLAALLELSMLPLAALLNIQPAYAAGRAGIQPVYAASQDLVNLALDEPSDPSIIDGGYCGAYGNEQNVIWTLFSDGALVISGSGQMAVYSMSGQAPWINLNINNLGRIKSIRIEEGVTNVGDRAFGGISMSNQPLPNLTKVTIAASVATIGTTAFYLCTALAEITFLGSTPPTTNYMNTFGGAAGTTVVPNGTIHCPEGSAAAYRGWKSGAAPLADWTVDDGTGGGADELVCEIGSTGFYSLADALVAHTDGQTITLLADIDYHSGISIIAKNMTFDVNGFILNVINDSNTGTAWGTGLDVEEGTLLLIDSVGGGELNVIASYYSGSLGVYAHSNSQATVTNASGAFVAAYVEENSQVTIEGMVSSGDNQYYLYVEDYMVKSDGVASDSKPGYLEYSRGSSTVWVKDDGTSELEQARVAKLYLIQELLHSYTETNYTADSWSVFFNSLFIAYWAVNDAPTLEALLAVQIPDAEAILVLIGPAVCEINNRSFNSLSGALYAHQDGQTIKLLTDIDYTGGMYVTDKTLTFDTNGFVLNIYGDENTVDAISVMFGGELKLIDTSVAGDGQLNGFGFGYAGAGIYVHLGNATLTNAYGGDYGAVQVFSAGQVVVEGAITGNSYIGFMDYSSFLAMGPTDGVPSLSKEGYLEYKYGSSSTVYVKAFPLAPQITGLVGMRLVQGYFARSTEAYVLRGWPVPDVQKLSGSELITWNAETRALDIAPGLTSGSYDIVLQATNSVGSQTLTVIFTVADHGVCVIGSEEYGSLGDALAAYQNGQTIQLLEDIDYQTGSVTYSGNIGVEVVAKTLTFDLNGYTLDIITHGGNAMVVRQGGCVLLTDSSAAQTGELNVTGISYSENSAARGVVVYDMNSQATVTNASGSSSGALAESNGTITVLGNAETGGVSARSNGLVTIYGYTSDTYADNGTVIAYGDSGRVYSRGEGRTTVYGNVASTSSGIEVYGGTAIVYGNVIAQDVGVGVYYSNCSASVGGDIFSGSTGTFASGGTVTVHGNITSTGGYAGVYAVGGAKIIVNGTVSAASNYAAIYSSLADISYLFGESDGVVSIARPGYFEYTDSTSFIWIRDFSTDIGDPILDYAYIRVTAGADIGAYRKGNFHFTEFTQLPLIAVPELSDASYDVYKLEVTSSCNIIAVIPGQTAKYVRELAALAADTTITIDLTPLADWPVVDNGYMAANMYTNLDASGVLNLAVGQSFDLDTFRVWQAPVGPVGYNFYEPDYSFELSGNSVAMERIGSEGRQQLRITALQPGTSVIKVSYGPIEVENQIGSVSRFNAIDPSAVGAVVIQVAGSGEIVVMGGDGGDGIAGIAGSVGEASAVISAAGSSFATGLSTDIDHDIFYFDQAEGSRTYTFTPASGTTVRVHNPLNISGWGTGWTAYTAAVDGSYTITLQSGRNIIELSQGGNVQYYLLRAKGVEVAVINSTNPGQPFALGDVALIQIRGIEEAIEKLCGVYNPGYGIPQYVSYTDGVSTVNSQNGVQYRSLTTTYSVNYTVTDLDAVLSGQYYMGMMAYEQRDVGWHRSIPLAGLLSAPDGWAIPKGPFAFGSLPEIHFAEAGEPEDPLVLQAAKDTRAALINAVLSGLVETDYTPQSWTALGAAVDAALTAVENATTVVEVEAVTVPDALSILVLKLAVGAPQSGDLNGDGIVDIAEALLIAQVVVGGGMTLSAEQFAAVDMDGDGLLTMADIVLMMRRAAGLP